MNYGDLDRAIQFQREVVTNTGNGVVSDWQNLGEPEPSARTDASDAEKAAAGTIEGIVVSRFVVRSSSFTRDIRPKDRFTTEGQVFSVTGIKQVGRRDYLEITAEARLD